MPQEGVKVASAARLGSGGVAYLAVGHVRGGGHTGVLYTDSENLRSNNEIDEQPASVPAAAGGSAADIQKLADLHAQGLLSDEEFSAAKAKVLSP